MSGDRIVKGSTVYGPVNQGDASNVVNSGQAYAGQKKVSSNSVSNWVIALGTIVLAVIAVVGFIMNK